MKNSYIGLIMLAMLTTMSSCKKDDESTIFHWDETMCADPWIQDSADTEEKRKESIEDYLAEQKVDVEDIEFEFDASKEEFCEACNCKTGRVIIVDVPKSDRRKMQRLNFYQK